MEDLIERLTTTEAAITAGVSVQQIHRMIDEKILPEDLYSTAQMRTFRTDACVLTAFYFETAELLTAPAPIAPFAMRCHTARHGMDGRTASLRSTQLPCISPRYGKASRSASTR